jgi:hypothetical protein
MYIMHINITHDSGHYPSSRFSFKTQINTIGLAILHKKHITLRYEPNRLMLSIGL